MSEFVTLDYGSGGKKTSQLISEMILPLINGSADSGNGDGAGACAKDVDGAGATSELCDGAVLPAFSGQSDQGGGKLVFSTDSFVVSPYIFPGGDIGKLSVCGTVNDIAMMGAKPQYLSLSFIIEEGMPLDDLRLICESIGKTAKEAGVQIVTGDTKVVDRGRGDGIYINTAGIGFLEIPYELKPENIRPGDVVIISGNVGNHGTAVMLARNERLGIHSEGILSDCAPLQQEAIALYKTLGSDLRVMRDPTRGGLATTLNEFVEHRKDIGIELKDTEIPVTSSVRTACDMLGLDPLYCACEGRLIAIVAPERAEEAVGILRKMPHGSGAKVIGFVTGDGTCEDTSKVVSDAAENGARVQGTRSVGKLVIRTALGTGRIAAKLSGAQLPRIC